MARHVITISEAEILSELDGALAVSVGPTEARTVQEIQEAKGWSRDRAYDALKALGKQGRLMVHQVQRKAINNEMRWVPAYTVTPKPPKSRARHR